MTVDAGLTETLSFSDPPKNTSVSVDPSGPVLDGSSVTLTCASIANPVAVNFTWFRVAGREKEMVGFEREFTFNVTKLSEDQYYCEALNVHGAEYSEPVSIDVTCEIYLLFNLLQAYIFPKKFDRKCAKSQLPSLSQLLQRSCRLPAVSRFYPRSDVPATARGTRLPPWFGNWLGSLSITLLTSRSGRFPWGAWA